MSPKIELVRLINVQFKNHGDEKNSFYNVLNRDDIPDECPDQGYRD